MSTTNSITDAVVLPPAQAQEIDADGSGPVAKTLVYDENHRPTGFKVRDHLDNYLMNHPVTNGGPAIGLLRVLADHVLADKPDNPRYGYVNGRVTKHAILAILTGTSERTVRRNLRVLDDLKYIKRYERKFSDGQRGPDDIQLLFLHWIEVPEEVPANVTPTGPDDRTPPVQMAGPPGPDDRTPPVQMAAQEKKVLKKGEEDGNNRAERGGQPPSSPEGQDLPPAADAAPPSGGKLDAPGEEDKRPAWFRWEVFGGRSYVPGGDFLVINYKPKPEHAEIRPDLEPVDADSHDGYIWLNQEAHEALLPGNYEYTRRTTYSPRGYDPKAREKVQTSAVFWDVVDEHDPEAHKLWLNAEAFRPQDNDILAGSHA